ncbi:MAG TPA: formate C-acetyltransferase [Clostridia bacterium]|nr:formate C-acetyltransferase [Clostridia bacterium]
MKKEWQGFVDGNWTKTIDVRDFINKNYSPYDGDESFLAPPTQRTKELLEKVETLLQAEKEAGGVLDIDTKHISSLLSFSPGYIDKDKEIIVGLQTDKPLKRSVNPFGGIRMSQKSCEEYGYKLDEGLLESFRYRTTHNDGVFRVYTDEMKKVRHTGIITGLPDAYGRGRIIGDYRRVALYGMDYLIEQKKQDKLHYGQQGMSEENIRILEDLYKQIEFMEQLKTMALQYGDDISNPAKDAREAVQWLYYAYLGAVKEQNGAANSIGRITTFLDIYIQRDISRGILTESEAQELIDDLIIKLRMVRHLRTASYNDLFAGDPVWVTMAEGGMTEDGRHMVTKSAFRVLNTLYNLKPAPEPNITILWSENLPESYKKFCTKVSIDTDSIQYENDEVMRPVYGDDYSIACCVSAMRTGKQMQYFGARCNIAKVLLMALNGGRDEISGEQVGPEGKVFEGVLKYDDVIKAYDKYAAWVAELYVNTLNIIHYMHDKYAYERLMMSLHDTDVERIMAFGICGLSVLADSLSAIKYAKVTPVKDETGLIVDFITEGDFPKYGNDDDRADSLAVWIAEDFFAKLKKVKTYRNAIHTLSVLTITSNVVYGKKTGSTPDGRKKGQPFAPGANPMHGRDCCGAVASLNSVAKLKYNFCRDGISNTFSVTPDILGEDIEERKTRLMTLIDGYFAQRAHHLNVNVLNKEKLIDAMDHPENYPNLTIRVSGYAVNFNKLSKNQQMEVISRTFHTKM